MCVSCKISCVLELIETSFVMLKREYSIHNSISFCPPNVMLEKFFAFCIKPNKIYEVELKVWFVMLRLLCLVVWIVFSINPCGRYSEYVN